MISLKVEIGAGTTSDALEECYQLGLKLQIPVQFEANDSKWEVFPNWASAMQVTKPGGEMISWNRVGNRDWKKKRATPTLEPAKT